MVIINIDGAARGNPGPSGYGAIAKDNSGKILQEAFGFLGNQTNNYAEYSALLAALKLAEKHNWQELKIKSDSQLMVRQLNGEYRVKNENLAVLFNLAKAQIRKLKMFRIEHVMRTENKEADKLANKAVDELTIEPADVYPFEKK